MGASSKGEKLVTKMYSTTPLAWLYLLFDSLLTFSFHFILQLHDVKKTSKLTNVTSTTGMADGSAVIVLKQISEECH